MPGKPEDISKIYKLAEIDRIIADSTQNLDDSPVAKKIKEVRAKKAQVKEKRDQIDVLFIKTRSNLRDISDKDSQIVQAQNKLQKEIEATSGDYRKVQDNTNKLAELKTQREEIDAKLAQLEDNYKKIEALRTQIEGAIGRLSLQEEDLTKLFVEQNATNTRDLSQATKDRKNLQNEISPDVLKLYSQALDRVGTNCIAELGNPSETEGNHIPNDTCSVCKNRLTAGQMSSAQKAAPFFKCPHCGRLLIVR